MGCFIGCFGRSKDRKRRKQRNRVLPQDKQSPGFPISHQNDALTEQRANDSSPIRLVSELRDKSEEKSSSSSKKRVTFDSNVKTYEHVSLCGSVDSLPETNSLTALDKETFLAKVNEPLLLSSSEGNSVSSSVGSYTPNYRYQNCTDSDDEIEEYGDSDLDNVNDDDDDDYKENYTDDDDYVDDAFVGEKLWSASNLTASMGSITENLSTQVTKEEAESPIKMSTGNARNRSDYVHSVLNPVENLAQWKTVKSRSASQLTTPQKENNLSLVTETPRISFSSESKVKRSGPYNEVAVDASLSTWLSTCESSTLSKTSSFEAVTSEEKVLKLQSPNGSSVRSLEDRPILGAWTVEELKHLSKTTSSSSPRKSPSRSPDEMPIIGSVGTYWNDSIAYKDSPSVLSYKGSRY